MKEKLLKIFSNAISFVMSPFLLVLLMFAMMFLFTHLAILPLYYKLYVLLYVSIFTILIPLLAIFAWLVIKKQPVSSLRDYRNRNIPYALTLLSYYLGYLQMSNMLLPHYMLEIMLVAITVMLVNSLINIWWKISAHAAGAGAMTAGIVIYGLFFGVNVVWPLCIMILLSGMLGTARMILKQHSLAQILAGYLNGFICTMIIIY